MYVTISPGYRVTYLSRFTRQRSGESVGTPKIMIRQAPSGILQTPSAELSLVDIARRFPLPWSAYVRLLSVKSESARRFYDTESLQHRLVIGGGSWCLCLTTIRRGFRVIALCVAVQRMRGIGQSEKVGRQPHRDWRAECSRVRGGKGTAEIDE